MPPLHRMATFVPPVCDHKICQVVVGGSKGAEWLPRSFKGGTHAGGSDNVMDAMVAVNF